ncbi:MAG: hypothetical protein ABIO70_31970 [Pseudomonadota bacterium]
MQRMPNKPRTAFLLFAIAGLAPLRFAVAAENETPDVATAVLFEPCTGVDLASVAVDGAGEPDDSLGRLAEYQHYGYQALIGPAAANATTWAALGQAGVLRVHSHGGASGFRIGCYGPGDQATRNADYDALLRDGVYQAGQIGKVWSPDEHNVALSHGINLTQAGIEATFSDANTIILLDACHGSGKAEWFGSREFFAYPDTTCVITDRARTKLLFETMIGHIGHGEYRPANEAYDMHAAAMPPLEHVTQNHTTTAPRVEEVDPRGVAVGTNDCPCTVSTTVTLDTKIDVGQDATAAVSVEGCDGATLSNQAWNGDDKLDFDIEIPNGATGLMKVTIHADHVLSGNNQVQLDGNWEGNGNSGVGPNEDDYVYYNICSARDGGVGTGIMEDPERQHEAPPQRCDPHSHSPDWDIPIRYVSPDDLVAMELPYGGRDWFVLASYGEGQDDMFDFGGMVLDHGESFDWGYVAATYYAPGLVTVEVQGQDWGGEPVEDLPITVRDTLGDVASGALQMTFAPPDESLDSSGSELDTLVEAGGGGPLVLVLENTGNVAIYCPELLFSSEVALNPSVLAPLPPVIRPGDEAVAAILVSPDESLASGSYDLSITLVGTSSMETTSEHTFEATVTVDRPPELSGPETLDNEAGAAITLTATDPDGEATHFFGESLPMGVSLLAAGDGTATVSISEPLTADDYPDGATALILAWGGEDMDNAILTTHSVAIAVDGGTGDTDDGTGDSGEEGDGCCNSGKNASSQALFLPLAFLGTLVGRMRRRRE